MANYQVVLVRLMTAQAFENVNIYILLLKTSHLKPVATRHQLQGRIVFTVLQPTALAMIRFGSGASPNFNLEALPC